jgi:hypothetical protein
MILPFFQTYLCYCELLWQHFPPVLLKFQLYQLQCTQEVARKFSGLEENSRTLHHTQTQYLCIHYSKINAVFSQNFSTNHRINTQTPTSWSWIKLTKNVILYLGRRGKKIYSKNAMFCADFTKTIISRSPSLVI